MFRQSFALVVFFCCTGAAALPIDARGVTEERLIEERVPGAVITKGLDAGTYTEITFDRDRAVGLWLFIDGRTEKQNFRDVRLRLSPDGRLLIYFRHLDQLYFHQFKSFRADEISFDGLDVWFHRRNAAGEREFARLGGVEVHVDNPTTLAAQTASASLVTLTTLFTLPAPLAASAAIITVASMVTFDTCARLLYEGINRPKLRVAPWRPVPAVD